MDLGKRIPKFAEKHCRECPLCESFLQFSESLAERSAKDASLLFKENPIPVEKSLLSKLTAQPESKFKRKHTRLTIPAFSTVIAALVIAIVIVMKPFSSSQTENSVKVNSIFPLSVSNKSISELAVKTESPYEKEMLGLIKAAASTSEYLKSCFDFGIDTEI
jgi:hypothetical protein